MDIKSSSGAKQPRPGADDPSLFIVEVNERVELYLHFLSVLRLTLLFYFSTSQINVQQYNSNCFIGKPVGFVGQWSERRIILHFNFLIQFKTIFTAVGIVIAAIIERLFSAIKRVG